jgi:methylphosphotriester-DNA--protein-cysteine methyltransferase
MQGTLVNAEEGHMQALNGCRTTRIYCRENCPPGRRTKPENRVTFTSEAAAKAAGYRACKVCRPDVLAGPWRPKKRAVA